MPRGALSGLVPVNTGLRTPRPGEVMLAVKAVGLNFRCSIVQEDGEWAWDWISASPQAHNQQGKHPVMLFGVACYPAPVAGTC